MERTQSICLSEKNLYLSDNIKLFIRSIFVISCPEYDSIYDACGPDLRRSCRRLYYSYWPGAIIMSGVSLSALYTLISHANGTAIFYFAITDLRILKLTTPPHLLGGRKLSQVDCKGLTAEAVSTALYFRSAKKIVIGFAGLPYSEVLQARDAFYSQVPIEGKAMKYAHRIPTLAAPHP